jgi:diguanylate cyclase (GGDEF)-like protein
MSELLLGATLGILGLIIFLSCIIGWAYAEPVLYLLAMHAAVGVWQLMDATGASPWPHMDDAAARALSALQLALISGQGLLVLGDPRRSRRVQQAFWLTGALCLMAGLLGFAMTLPPLLGDTLLALVALQLAWAIRRSWSVCGQWKWWFAGGQAFFVLLTLLAAHVQVAGRRELLLALALVLQVPMVYLGLVWRSRMAKEVSLRMDAMATTDPLTGLATMKIVMDRLEGATRRSRRFGYQSTLFLIELENLSEIARLHGEQARETAMLLAGSCLRSLLKDVDVAGRVASTRFALLVEGLEHDRSAPALATSIVAHGLMSEGRSLPGLELEFRVAYGLLPPNTQALNDLLSRLDDALRELQAQGGKKIAALASPVSSNPFPRTS